jgi:outer membrane receptor protein involved in Fe transport
MGGSVSKGRLAMNPMIRRIGLCCVALLLVCAAVPLFAGTTGKIAGRVLDEKKEPLPSANVIIAGTKLGAVTDIDGYYAIINVPPGTYVVQVRLVGYRPYSARDVLVSVNNTTKVDAALEDASITTSDVVVTAQRPVVDVGATSTTATISDNDIKTLPVQELQDIVNLQAGVVDGHFRGGRAGEVQYQVNGVSVNNVFDNSSTVRIDRSLIQEVQVITGTFDAEYGQAMSGVVNTVLKSGGENFTVDAEAFAGSYLYGNDGYRNLDYTFRPATTQNYQLSISGPTGIPHTFFLVNARRYHHDDYLYGKRVFTINDSVDFAHTLAYPTGDGSEVAMGYTREWSGLAKITNRSIGELEISYSLLFNLIEGKNLGGSFAWRINPDGTTTQKKRSFVHGLDITHTMSASTFYTVSLRQNYFDYTDWAYEDFYDSRYDLVQQGPMSLNADYNYGAIVKGVELGRYMQKTDTYLAKVAVTSQVTRAHQIKAGAEVQWSKMEFGAPGWLVSRQFGNTPVLVRVYDDPPDYPGARSYTPLSGAAYLHDLIEWNDLTIRAGVRVEYFDGRSTIPADLANPANAIPGAPTGTKSTTKKISVAPRLGISYPITSTSSVYFSYGHFYQLPNLGDMYRNADYSRLSLLQAGALDYGVLGNPDVKPERTVQYEVGYKNALSDAFGISVNLFYKDIRDLLGVQFVNTYTGAQYSRLSNIDFGNVTGFTLSLDQRRMGMLSTSLDYTWQLAQGNSSDPQETANLAQAGLDARPQTLPFSWDQRHTINLTVQLSDPEEYSLSAVLRYASGQPYTPSIGLGLTGQIERNSGRKPEGFLVDFRGEKYFKVGGWNMSVFARVFNLFNARYFNGSVFANTGSPDYSTTPYTDRNGLADPTRYYAPRRFEIGVSLNSSL